MCKQWQWIWRIEPPAVAMRRQPTHGGRLVADNAQACGAAHGVERRQRAWFDCSVGSGERQPTRGVA